MWWFWGPFPYFPDTTDEKGKFREFLEVGGGGAELVMVNKV